MQRGQCQQSMMGYACRLAGCVPNSTYRCWLQLLVTRQSNSDTRNRISPPCRHRTSSCGYASRTSVRVIIRGRDDLRDRFAHHHGWGAALERAREVRSAAKALSSDWEVFASILVKDVGTKLGKGVDLSKHEVKSAEEGGSYEYQYHKNSGKDKLREDMQKGHLFFDHRDNAPQWRSGLSKDPSHKVGRVKS
jgi:hypothetical protein